MLESTVVLAFGEFGRTPKISPAGGLTTTRPAGPCSSPAGPCRVGASSTPSARRMRLRPEGPARDHSRDRRDRLPRHRHRPGHRAAGPQGSPLASSNTASNRSRENSSDPRLPSPRNRLTINGKENRNAREEEATKYTKYTKKGREEPFILCRFPHKSATPSRTVSRTRTGSHLTRPLSLSFFVYFVFFVVNHSSSFSFSTCYAGFVESGGDLSLLPPSARVLVGLHARGSGSWSSEMRGMSVSAT